MNRNRNPMLRALYIVLVPVVLLIILLNSGMLQKAVPAARVHGQSYTVTRYNYYYFDYYNTFLEENENNLEELGYDPAVSDTSQYTAGGSTWKAFFLRQGEAALAETAYYYDLAQAAGYEFSEEELLPIETKLAANAAAMAASNINAKNYYAAYYGAGMTEALYTAELTRQVKAQAYKNYLIRSTAPTEADIRAYIAQNAIPDYRTADLRIITLDALPDRETGEVGPEQLDALARQLTRLEDRYNAGESFESLQAAFSTCALGSSQGYLYSATRLDMPADLADALLLGGNAASGEQNGSAASGEQNDISAGGYYAGVSGNTAYFILVDAVGAPGSGPEREAALALGQDALLARAQADIRADYQVIRQRFGMLLATA